MAQIISPLNVCNSKIIGHEIGHGVTDHEAGIAYSGEAQGLHEGYSDMWGTLLEFYLEGSSADWTVCEDVYVSNNSFPNYLRSMINPHACGNPDSYNGTFYSTGCNPTFGGLCADGHNINGVFNHWFYLLSQGGSGTNNAPSPYTFNVTGIGMSKSAQIAYRAYTYLWHNATYANMRDASIQAAFDLYGDCSNEMAQVKEAWNAVGVYGTNSCMNTCLNSSNAGCSGNTGSASVSVTGGVSPYSYQWYDAATNSAISGATNSAITGLAPGTYYVVVNDNGVCTVTSLNAMILGGGPSIAGLAANNSTCTGPNGDGIASVVPSGGVPPYSILWDAAAGNQTTSTATNLAAGSYNVTVTDVNGCSISGSVTIGQNPLVFDVPYQTIITGNTIWNQALIRVDGQVTVDNGATLTIASGTKVEFVHHPDPLDPMPNGVARLIVSPGGNLIIQSNVTLTGCGGGIWDGIEVWGTGIFNNGAGYLQMNGSNIVVENADIGVYSAGRPKINQSIANNSGGNVYIVGASFNNNRQGIVLPRDFGSHLYHVVGAGFKYDKNSKYSNSYTQYLLPTHIYAGENVNLTYHGLFFGGINDFPSDKSGFGLRCDDCKATAFNNGPFSPTIFAGLTRAVEANYSFTSNQLNVDNALVTSCQEGIYMQGSSLAEIKNSTFELPPPIAPNTKSYGVFSVGSTGFDISGNTITPLISDPASYGMVIENSGVTGGVIFNNTFNDVGIGIQAQKDNQNLKVGCNNFNNPNTLSLAVVNITGFPTSLMKQQGQDCAADGHPAGNEWPYSCNQSTSTANVFADNLVTFRYYSYKADQSGNPTTKPLCSSSIWKSADMLPWVCNSLANKTSSSCTNIFALPPPPPFTPYSSYYIAIKNLINSYQSSINSLKNQLASTLVVQDGGNQPHLLNQISTLPAGKLRNVLLSSNVLSDKALIAVVNRISPLPPGVLKDVLIPQAPLSLAVLSAIENLSQPLPAGIKSSIYVAQTNTPTYTNSDKLTASIRSLEGDIILLRSEFQRTRLRELNKICRDCILPKDGTSNLLFTQDYATGGYTDSMRITLPLISADSSLAIVERQNFVAYMNTIADMKDGARTIETANPSEISTMQSVASTNTKASVHANAALKLRNMPYQNYFIADIPISSLRLGTNATEETNEQILFSNNRSFVVFPNPNNGNFNIQLDAPNESDDPIEITLTNLMGQVVHKVTFDASTEKNLEVRDFHVAPGIYILDVRQGKSSIGQSKLIKE